MRTRVHSRLVTQQHHDDEVQSYIRQLMNAPSCSQAQIYDDQSNNLNNSVGTGAMQNNESESQSMKDKQNTSQRDKNKARAIKRPQGPSSPQGQRKKTRKGPESSITAPATPPALLAPLPQPAAQNQVNAEEGGALVGFNTPKVQELYNFYLDGTSEMKPQPFCYDSGVLLNVTARQGFLEFVIELERRNWRVLAHQRWAVNQTLLKEFFANAAVLPRSAREVTVRGKMVPFHPQAFSTVLEIPPMDEKEYTDAINDKTGKYRIWAADIIGDPEHVGEWQNIPGATILKPTLIPTAKNWLSLITYRIQPTLNLREVPEKTAIPIAAIMKGWSINVGAVITSTLLELLTKPQREMPGPATLTQLMKLHELHSIPGDVEVGCPIPTDLRKFQNEDAKGGKSQPRRAPLYRAPVPTTSTRSVPAISTTQSVPATSTTQSVPTTSTTQSVPATSTTQSVAVTSTAQSVPATTSASLTATTSGTQGQSTHAVSERIEAEKLRNISKEFKTDIQKVKEDIGTKVDILEKNIATDKKVLTSILHTMSNNIIDTNAKVNMMIQPPGGVSPPHLANVPYHVTCETFGTCLEWYPVHPRLDVKERSKER